MANYGFAIDLRKCIGCHACTIACKAEHQIPIGVNRCWVKTVEKGTFPTTRRFFFPVLCNQCEEAPCVRICPPRALFRRRDGIVDLQGDACIGCRACMVACPYDQLFIDPNTHTAEKCNFCANRVENELLPACVSVCPTECRIFGDLDDPASEVARIARLDAIAVRKPEKGTVPKVIYIGAEESAIRPNWRSWMVWGAYFLTLQGAITAAWIGAAWLGIDGALTFLAWPAIVSSLLATCYTGFLFAQGLARDLWQGPHAAIDLLAQAVIEGSAVMLIVLAVFPSARSGGNAAGPLVVALAAALFIHLAFLAVEQLTPSPTRHHELASRAIRQGAFASYFWGGAIVAGGLLPLALVAAASIVEQLQTPALAAIIATL